MPGGHSTFFGFVNAFIHIVMYTYYMMAAIGPEMQKYLWWKKYLTILQMIQFISIMIHAFQLFLSNPCDYPMAFAYWIGAHAVMFYFLFSNFYQQAYKTSKTKTVDDINGNMKQEIGKSPEAQTYGHLNGTENEIRRRFYNKIPSQ